MSVDSSMNMYENAKKQLRSLLDDTIAQCAHMRICLRLKRITTAGHAGDQSFLCVFRELKMPLQVNLIRVPIEFRRGEL